MRKIHVSLVQNTKNCCYLFFFSGFCYSCSLICRSVLFISSSFCLVAIFLLSQVKPRVRCSILFSTGQQSSVSAVCNYVDAHVK